MNKVAIYHLSLDPTRKSCIDIQMDILKHYANSHNWEIVKIYYDNSNLEGKKQELQQLLIDCQKGMFDIVLMKNAYFISRSTPKFISFWKTLKSNNVTLYTLTEGQL